MTDASLFETWSPVAQDFGLVRGDQAVGSDAYAAMFAGTAALWRRTLAGDIRDPVP